MTNTISRTFTTITLSLSAVLLLAIGVSGQSGNGGSAFRLGEKLTYNVSFEHFDNAAFAEIFVVSAGKLSGRDGIEVRSRFKTLSFVSAAFYLVDEATTSYASPETGLPLYSRKDVSSGGVPKVEVRDNLANSSSGHDLNTLIYAIRSAAQGGVFDLNADDRSYTVTVHLSGAETIKTAAGEFETTAATIDSEFFTERGITELTAQISNDEARIPVVVKFRTPKGMFVATIAGVQMISTRTEPSPTPVATPTPQATPVPTPSASPTPVPDNQPLSTLLPFVLGETLKYRISSGGTDIGTAMFKVQSRTIFQGFDSLLLSASVDSVAPGSGMIQAGDFMRSRVDPVSLVPQNVELQISTLGNRISGTANWDARTGAISYGSARPLEAPVGTHSILSLLYAMRSFNLKPSRNVNNPVNDTRVAVFLTDRTSVFSLRPGAPETLDQNGLAVTAQPVTITANIPELDALKPKIWLSGDDQRLPLRITIGYYQLDLISSSVIR